MIPYEKGKYPTWVYVIDILSTIAITVLMALFAVSLIKGQNPIVIIKELLRLLLVRL